MKDTTEEERKKIIQEVLDECKVSGRGLYNWTKYDIVVTYIAKYSSLSRLTDNFGLYFTEHEMEALRKVLERFGWELRPSTDYHFYRKEE